MTQALVRLIGMGAAIILCGPLFGQTLIDVNPNQSTLDPTDPDGASGGRVNGLASVPGDNRVFYAASEWGGIYRSVDAGRRWARLDRHLPTVTWDVEVNRERPNTVYATSFYDGRVNTLAGINVSTDGGNTWSHPATATPPANLCANARREEPSAFGIGVDSDKPANVFIGTNCGLAISNDFGATWRYVDPTPTDAATNVWDVVVHHGGIVDICGDDGHLRSVDGGASWAPGSGLPSGVCSIAASPFEKEVLLAAVGANAWESDNGGVSWTNLGTPDARRQGRVMFVATNRRGGEGFDLWYGDVSLFRARCGVGGAGLRCPMARTGAAASPPPAGWSGPFTRSAGAHDDAGDLVFDTKAQSDPCPALFSSDGGVYFNTKTTSPDCHTPLFEQPDVTPHGLWPFGMDGALKPGAVNEDLYFGNQDNGTFATTNAGAAAPAWTNRDCCDGFDDSADPNRVLYTVCCFSPPANRLFRRGPGMAGGGLLPAASHPPGALPGFRAPDIIDQFGPDDYVIVSTSGVFITNDGTASPIVWTQIGAPTTPAGACSVQAAVDGSGTPMFYVQAPNCDGRNPDRVFRFVGTNPAGAWTPVNPPSPGFGVFTVDARNPSRLFASNLTAMGPKMIRSDDGGTTWQDDVALDNLMTAAGAFRYQNRRGPTDFTGFGGYPQPTLVAFDPNDPMILAAGGADSGLFLSTGAGTNWKRVSDPIDSGNSGVPHLPRPRFAYFDHLSSGDVNLFVGMQGRGVWRVGFRPPQYRFEYPAKIVCGVQKGPKEMRLAMGFYATTINIHNGNETPVTLFKKLALSFPPEEQKPGKILPIAEDELKSDEALKVDCTDIRQRLFPNGFLNGYIEGIVVIRSTERLDVTAVYTTAALDRGGQAGAHSSIDVGEVREREIRESKDRPDLVPIPDANGDFCKLRDDMLVVTVRSQGTAAAGTSTTEVAFRGGTVTQPTPALAPGASTDLLFQIPAGCFSPDCSFRITVDSISVVMESNEANNVAEGSCLG
jgi:hypothetical protein